MKLEVGKKYVNRRGTVIEIYAKHPFADVLHGALDVSRKVDEYDRGIIWMQFSSDGTAILPNGNMGNLVREFEEPVEYSVDVWVKERPEPSENHGCNLGRRLFGDTSWHLSSGSETCRRHLRVTVEEVVE